MYRFHDTLYSSPIKPHHHVPTTHQMSLNSGLLGGIPSVGSRPGGVRAGCSLRGPHPCGRHQRPNLPHLPEDLHPSHIQAPEASATPGQAHASALLVVGGSTMRDERSAWSDYGAHIGVVAPGEGIWTTVAGSRLSRRPRPSAPSELPPQAHRKPPTLGFHEEPPELGPHISAQQVGRHVAAAGGVAAPVRI